VLLAGVELEGVGADGVEAGVEELVALEPAVVLELEEPHPAMSAPEMTIAVSPAARGI
jgi:hypothetical protein